ncbi:MAG TPA: hypothetical protein VD905_01010 [Flavobacteriales bacterium]|nr:hypothetical protein [Flavobacteriales bacterium]
MHAQKNAFGLSGGFYRFRAPAWDELLDKYNSGDTVTSPQPGFTHTPLASFFYERKVKDYLYTQVHFSYGFMQSVSYQGGELKLKVQLPGAGISLNWYPVKMIKGFRKSALNPILVQFNFRGLYQKKELTLNGAPVWDADSTDVFADNVGLFIGAGIGYDLHFGRRLVIQTIFDGAFCPSFEMIEFEYFIPLHEKLGYSLISRATLFGGHLSFLFLF